MKFEAPLQQARLIKRYKRFLVDVDNGEEIFTIHCPNTGAMTGCAEPGAIAWYSDSNNPKRKYRHTLELVQSLNGYMIGVNTHRANTLIEEAFMKNKISGMENHIVKREVKVGDSRLDFMLTPIDDKTQHFVEVKSVTLGPLELTYPETGKGYFPDAVSTRAIKHLHELEKLVNRGQLASLLFCVQHSGINEVHPARHIYPQYAEALQHAADSGVNIRAFSCLLSPERIEINEEIPVVI